MTSDRTADPLEKGQPAGPVRPSSAFYVIVRGPLGVGKSTVSLQLAERLGAKYISIDRILEEADLWVEGALPEFLRANDITISRARESLTRGTPVIVDGNFYWKTQIQDLIERLDFRGYVFTLRASLEVCIARDAERESPFGEAATTEVFAKTTRFEWGTEVDANGRLEAVIDEIVARLSGSQENAVRAPH
ncbi:MAG: AAA family ATPase [Thermoplasmata archaeon]